MKPKLRDIKFQPMIGRGQQGFFLSDPLGITQKTLFMPIYMSLLLDLLDGTRDVSTIKTGFELRTGRIINHSDLELMISRLDDALFLENEKFLKAYKDAINDYRASTTRKPILAGSCYPEDPEVLKDYLQKCLDQLSDDNFQETNQALGMICPHIDYHRGASIYAKVWSKIKKSLEQTELIVILGTDHTDAKGSITLTRQNYETPLGIVTTAEDIVEEFARDLGDKAFDNELNHRGEHSIESALVWLQYLLGENTCPIVPILCGSFYRIIEEGVSPIKTGQIVSTINMLSDLYKRKRMIIVAAADLAHIGPEFGDPIPVDIAGRAEMARDDEELIQTMCQGDAEDFYSLIEKEKDCRHICGVPPIYITLASMSSVRGTSLGYTICPASPDQTSLVSICGILFQNRS